MVDDVDVAVRTMVNVVVVAAIRTIVDVLVVVAIRTMVDVIAISTTQGSRCPVGVNFMNSEAKKSKR